MTSDETVPFSHISLEEIVDVLSASERVLIVSHTNADGDTLGSAAALSYIAEALGAETRCITPEDVPSRLRFLMREEYSEWTRGDEAGYDTVCAVDVASREQLGSLSYLADENKFDFMIDHHETGTPFAAHYVDHGASAAGEIIYRLYRVAMTTHFIHPNPDVSRNIYAAIVSDTGSFKFSNVTPETHSVAAELVREINSSDDDGMKTDEICRTLFGRRSMSDLLAQALSISKLQVFENGSLGVVLLTRDDVTAAGLAESDVGNAVEVPRSLDGVKIALSVRQSFSDSTVFKVSSRSNCEANVAEVCALFGGGGHAKAAGCRLSAETPENALDILVEAFGKALYSGNQN